MENSKEANTSPQEKNICPSQTRKHITTSTTKKSIRIIHCTRKLIKELDVTLVEPDKILQPTEGLGNWYANLVRIDRRKCLLFTNEKTLYSFLIPKVLKVNLKNIEEEFLINLSYNLQNEGFWVEVINRVMQEYQEIGFARTMSKSVLGSMNDFAYHYEFQIMREGELKISEYCKSIRK